MRSRPVGPFGVNGASWQARGLVFWLPFMDEFPQDRIGNAVASVTGAPALAFDLDRECWVFSGTGQYTSFPFAAVTAVPLTVMAWVKPDSVSFTRAICSICASANTTNFFNLRFLSTGPAISFSSGDGTTSSATTSTSPVTGVWQHACGVSAATNSRACYLDGGGKGTQTSTRTPTGLNQTNPGVLGGSSFTLPFPAGRLADVRIYNRAWTDDEVLAIAKDPYETWDLFEPIVHYWSFSSSKSITADGAMTPSGVLVKTPTKLFVGTQTTSGTLIKQPLKVFLGTLTDSGALIKTPKKLFAGTLTSSGALIKQPQKVFAGAVTSVGTLVRPLVSKIFAGSITPTGILIKTPKKLFSGTSTSSGSLIKTPTKLFSGSVASSGTMIKTIVLGLSGLVTSGGVLIKKPFKIFDGSETPSGTLSMFRMILIVLSGSITPTGDLLKTPMKIFDGSVTPSGSLSKTITKLFTGVVTSSGALTLLRLIAIIVGGVVTMSGDLVKNVSKVFDGSETPSGALIKQVNLVFSGLVTSFGVLSTIKTVLLILSGVVTMSGELIKRPQKLFDGEVDIGGDLVKRMNLKFSGIVSSSGDLVTTWMEAITTTAILFKAMVKNVYKRMR